MGGRSTERKPRTALTIAGSDPSGGAGIQVDIKTIESIGVYAASAITAVTVQNTYGVLKVNPVSPETVIRQIEAVMDDIGADAMKTGMLVDENVVRGVAEITRRSGVPLIVDPVISSTSGSPLISEKGVEAIREILLPGATLTTPNVPEAEILSGIKIGNFEDIIAAGKRIRKTGVDSVLITGGHIEGRTITDVLIDKNGVRKFDKTRVMGKDPHGTGCMLSAAITGYVALGNDVATAIELSEALVRRAIRFAHRFSGGDVVEPLAWIKNEAARFPVLKEVRECMEKLEKENIYDLIPEVSSNFVVALPYALELGEAAGMEGRIVRLKDRIHAHNPWFGVSDHVARFLLNIRSADPDVNCSMNIMLTDRIRKRCEELGYEISYAPRMDEPEIIKEKEHQTMDWAASYVMKGRKKAPDIVVDEGAFGKEPMIRILAGSPKSLTRKVLDIWQGL